MIGTLPDYLVATGYQVTPVVGLIEQDFTLRLDEFEVAEVFEVPLTFLMDPANHERRSVAVGGLEPDVLCDALPGQAPVFHLGGDRGDAAQPLPLPAQLSRLPTIARVMFLSIVVP